MNRIVFKNGPRAGEAVDLTAGHITIGSDPGAAQIAIDDAAVASVHCRIASVKGGGFGVQDLGTDSGTFVNNKKTGAARIHGGDVIRIGSIEFVFESDAVASPPVEARPAPEPLRSAAPKSESAMRAGDADLTGRTLGGYEVTGILGRGGMGVVYKATQTSLHRNVALKVLSPSLAKDPKFVDLFLREARAAAQLHHQNVVTIYDVSSDQGLHYYSMELFDGGSVEQLLKKEKKLSVERALAIARDAARALEFAESKRLLHRDVKPDNLMLTSQGVAKLADLGLASHRDDRDSLRFGTPHFVAPECLTGGAVDHRSDLYSLGATLFRMLTGRTPFQGQTVQEILEGVQHREAPALRSIDNNIPEDVDALVARCLQKDPAARFAHAREIIEAIDAVLSPPQKAGSRLGLIAAGVLILAGGAYLIFRPKEPAQTQPMIVRDTAEEERLRQENAKKETMMREQSAELAYTRASAEDLSPVDRAARYEQIAKEFENTRAGANAAREAARLREEEAARVAREKERAQTLSTFSTALNEGLSARLSEGKFAESLQFARTLADYERVAADPEGKALIASIPGRVLEAVDSHIRQKLQKVDEDRLAGNIANADTSCRRLGELIDVLLTIPPDDLPPSAASNLKTYKSAIEKIRAQLTQAKGEQERAAEATARAAVVHRVLQLLDVEKLGKGGYAPAMAEQTADLAAAPAELQSLLKDMFLCAAASDDMVASVFAASEKKTLSHDNWIDPIFNKPSRVISVDANGVRIEPKAGPPGSATVIPFSKFTKGMALAELFVRAADKTADAQLKLARASLHAALAFDTLPLLRYQKTLKLDANNPNPAPEFSDECYQFALEAARGAQSAGAPVGDVQALVERIEKERDASKRWHAGLSAFARGDFEAADAAFSQMLQKDKTTAPMLLGGTGVGAESRPGR
jgi:hypothetical protein